MKTKFIKKIIIAMITFLSFSGCDGQIVPANLVMLNGKIFTMEGDNCWAEAIAIADKKIIYVGSNEVAKKFIDNNTEVLDLKQKLVLPSFVDSHVHPTSSYYVLYNLNLTEYSTHQDYINSIKEYAQNNPDREWILANGFSTTIYGKFGPTKELLDQTGIKRPIAVISQDGHSVWVNSKALQVAGITKNTPNPPGGVIVKDKTTGEPTGFLKEDAMQLVGQYFPARKKSEIRSALLEFQDYLSSQGITTIHDASIYLPDSDSYEVYNDLAAEGLLNMRIRGSFFVDNNSMLEMVNSGLESIKRFNHPHFKVHSFKFMADGVFGEQTAYMLKPYLNNKSNYGTKIWDKQDMLTAMQIIDKAGYQIHVHIMGDAAAKETLDVLETVQEINGQRDSRHSFAHVGLISPEDIERMGNLEMSAHISQYWHVIDRYYWDLNIPVLGENRANSTFPNKSLIDEGVNVTCASDFSVTWPETMRAIYYGMFRIIPEVEYAETYGNNPDYRYLTDPLAKLKFNDIGVHQPKERVSLINMLKSLTINGAKANFLEDKIGTIEIGKLADLVVIDTNLFEVKNSEEIAAANILMTFFEGRKVYDVNINPQ